MNLSRVVVFFVFFLATAQGGLRAQFAPLRPILITIDDLPIAATDLHGDARERRAITEGMLKALAKHRVPAVGLVTGKNHSTAQDEVLLDLWLKAGHELGNHSFAHLNYSESEITLFRDDIERERQWLAAYLQAHGKSLRFFRFPFLNEGDTPEKLAGMRDYLKSSGLTNLPVTIDDQDWSYERGWVTAERAGDRKKLQRIGADYQAMLRLHVEHFENSGDKLFGRTVPQIILLHAGAIGAAQWNEFFTWLESTGHRFATADEVLRDPAYQNPPAYIAENGVSLWDRIRFTRRAEDAKAMIRRLLDGQVAAWNSGDLAGYMAGYARDATYVSSAGNFTGREAILKRVQLKYPDQQAMGTLSLELIEIRFSHGDEFNLFGDAVPGRIQGVSAICRWRLSHSDKPGEGGLALLVFRPRAVDWEIVQHASM